LSVVTDYSDTHPEAEAVRLRLLRAAPAWRKLETLGQLNSAAKMLALSGLRMRYPCADESELRRRLADLLLGADLAARVYGSLQEEFHDS
jgi:hypothetical protein